MKKLLSILSVCTISGTSAVSFNVHGLNNTVKNNVIINETKVDYLTGTDADFTVYLGTDAIDIMTTDFSNGDDVNKVIDDLLTQTNFDLGTISRDALTQTFTYCQENISVVLSILAQEGTNGVSVEVINYVPDVDTATPIN